MKLKPALYTAGFFMTAAAGAYILKSIPFIDDTMGALVNGMDPYLEEMSLYFGEKLLIDYNPVTIGITNLTNCYNVAIDGIQFTQVELQKHLKEECFLDPFTMDYTNFTYEGNLAQITGATANAHLTPLINLAAIKDLGLLVGAGYTLVRALKYIYDDFKNDLPERPAQYNTSYFSGVAHLFAQSRQAVTSTVTSALDSAQQFISRSVP